MTQPVCRVRGFSLIDLLLSLLVLAISLLGYGLLSGMMIRETAHLHLAMVASQRLANAATQLMITPPCGAGTTPGCVDLGSWAADTGISLGQVLPAGEFTAELLPGSPATVVLELSWRLGAESFTRTAELVL